MSTPANSCYLPCVLHSATTHVFIKPSCDHLSTIKKIAIIVGHILTGGIFFLLARIVSYFSGTQKLTEKALQSVQLESYPPEGREAIKFAFKHLDQFPHRKKNTENCSSDHPFVSRLSTIKDHYNQELYRLVSSVPTERIDSDNPDYLRGEIDLKNQDVLRVVDSLMKITYAICCLALIDIPREAAREAKLIGREFTHANQLGDQGYWHYDSFLAFTARYHSFLRGKLHFNKKNLGIKNDSSLSSISLNTKTSNDHEDLFLQAGTLQYQWRQLYLDMFQRVKAIPGSKEVDGRRFFKIRFIKDIDKDWPPQVWNQPGLTP